MDDRTLFVITSDHNPHSGGEYKTLVPKAAGQEERGADSSYLCE
mgnify:CR=1 FL=1